MFRIKTSLLCLITLEKGVCTMIEPQNLSPKNTNIKDSNPHTFSNIGVFPLSNQSSYQLKKLDQYISL